MKYVVIDDEGPGRFFTEEYDSKEEAIQKADIRWERYTTNEEKRRTIEFYILESENPDEDAANHLDGNEIKRYK